MVVDANRLVLRANINGLNLQALCHSLAFLVINKPRIAIYILLHTYDSLLVDKEACLSQLCHTCEQQTFIPFVSLLP